MWNIEYSYYEGLWRKCDMDAFTSTLVTARQHNTRVPFCFFIACCFGSQVLSLFLFSSLFSFSSLYFFMSCLSLLLHFLPIIPDFWQSPACHGMEQEVNPMRWIGTVPRTRCHWMSCQEESWCMLDYCLLSFLRCSPALLMLGEQFLPHNIGFIWSGKKHSKDWNRHRLKYCHCIDLLPAVDLQHWPELSVWAQVIYVQCISEGSAYRKSCFHSCPINLRLCCWRHAEWLEPGSSGACLSSRANTCSFRLVPLPLLLKDSHRTASKLFVCLFRSKFRV